MKIYIQESLKVTEIWLSSEDKSSPDCQQLVETICKEQKAKQYKTVIFVSGTGNLKDLTKELLRVNTA